MKSFYRSSALLFFCTNVASALSYLFQAIMARHLSTADFGLMNALFGMLGFLSLPLTVCSTAWTRHWAELIKSGHAQEARCSWWSMNLVAFGAGIIAVALLNLFSESIARWFNTTHITAVRIALAGGVLTVIFGFAGSIATAHQWFGVLASSAIFASLFRVSLGVWGIHFHFPLSGAIVATSCASSILFLFVAWRIPPMPLHAFSLKPLLLPPHEWTGPVMASAAQFCMISSDMLVIRKVFDPQEAGVFAQVMILGKILFFVIAPLSVVILPKTARGGTSPSEPRIVRRTLGMGFFILMATVLGLVLFAPLALRLLTGASHLLTVSNLRIALPCLVPLALCQLVIPSFLGRRQEKILLGFLLISALLPVGLLFCGQLWHAFAVEGATGALLLLFLLANRTSLLRQETGEDSPVAG